MEPDNAPGGRLAPSSCSARLPPYSRDSAARDKAPRLPTSCFTSTAAMPRALRKAVIHPTLFQCHNTQSSLQSSRAAPGAELGGNQCDEGTQLQSWQGPLGTARAPKTSGRTTAAQKQGEQQETVLPLRQCIRKRYLKSNYNHLEHRHFPQELTIRPVSKMYGSLKMQSREIQH